MSEAITVLKTFIFTLLLLMMLQVRVGGSTLEAKTVNFVTRSGFALYIQSAAAGGALAVRNLVFSMKTTANEVVNGYKQGSSEQKASR